MLFQVFVTLYSRYTESLLFFLPAGLSNLKPLPVFISTYIWFYCATPAFFINFSNIQLSSERKSAWFFIYITSVSIDQQKGG